MVKKDILIKKGVVGYGKGIKIKDGVQTWKCVTVLVEKKLPKNQIAAIDLVPDTIGGEVTDVIEVGKIRALSVTGKYRPALGGCSIGHYQSTAGTLGCIVKDVLGKKYILSNNHVLANENNALVGDAILQPGPYDGGKNPADQIGILHKFVPINFGNTGQPPPPPVDPPPAKPPSSPSCSIASFTRSFVNFLAVAVGSSWRVKEYNTIEEIKKTIVWDTTPIMKIGEENKVDAALAIPLSEDLISTDILDIGSITGINEIPDIGMGIKKSGRTTGMNKSNILVTDATINVGYTGISTALFVGQIIAGALSQGGDSGSLVVDDTNRAVGLLFAGSDTTTIINPISDVMKELEITI